MLMSCGQGLKLKAPYEQVSEHHLWPLLPFVLPPTDESCSVFTDPVFSRSKHWRMSTSHLTHEQFDGWGWGEVVPDGE